MPSRRKQTTPRQHFHATLPTVDDSLSLCVTCRLPSPSQLPLKLQQQQASSVDENKRAVNVTAFDNNLNQQQLLVLIKDGGDVTSGNSDLLPVSHQRSQVGTSVAGLCDEAGSGQEEPPIEQLSRRKPDVDETSTMTSPSPSSPAASEAISNPDIECCPTTMPTPDDIHSRESFYSRRLINLRPSYNEHHEPVTDKVSAAAEALWRCYKNMNFTSPDLSWPAETTHDVVTFRDAAVLEDVLCGLRQQQLFQLHLLRQLQQQIDQLAVAGALLDPSHQPCQSQSAAETSTSTTVVHASRDGASPHRTKTPVLAAAPAASGNLAGLYMKPRSPTPSAMTSDLSPMSAMIDMSRKRLNQLPVCTSASALDPSAPADQATNDARRHGNGYYRRVCRYCRKEFHGESALQIHIRSHTGERPFKCSFCDSCFSTKGNLKVHMTGHSREALGTPLTGRPIYQPALTSALNSSSRLLAPTFIQSCRGVGCNNLPLQHSASSGSTSTCFTSSPNPSPDSGQYTTSALTATSIKNRCQENKPGVDDECRYMSTVNPDNSANSNCSNESINPSDGLTLKAAVTIPQSEPEQRQSIDVPSLSTNNFRFRFCPQTAASTSTSLGNRRGTTYLSSGRAPVDPLEQFMEVDCIRAEKSCMEKLTVGQTPRELDANQCAVCLRTLSCRSALLMHYRTHTGERPFRCRLCGRAFTTKGNLKTHMGVHRAKPPVRTIHACPVCRKLFSNSVVLQQHVRLHSQRTTGQVTQTQPPTPILNQLTSPRHAAVATTPVLMTSSLSAYLPFGTGYTPFFPLSVSTALPTPFDGVLCMQSKSPGTGSTSNIDVDIGQSSSDNCDSTSSSVRAQSESARTDDDDDNEEMVDVGTNDDGPTTATVGNTSPLSVSRGELEEGENITFEEEANTDDAMQRYAPVTIDNPLTHMERIVDRANFDWSARRPGRGMQQRSAHLLPDDVTVQQSQNNHCADIDLQAPFRPIANILTDQESSKANWNSFTNKASSPVNATCLCAACGRSCSQPLDAGDDPIYCRTCSESRNSATTPAALSDISDAVEQPRARSAVSDNDGHPDAVSDDIGKNELELAETSLTEKPSCLSTLPSSTTTSNLTDNCTLLATTTDKVASIQRHACEVCRKPFSSASALQIHMRTHTGDRPFRCDVCGKAFTTKGNLKVHAGTHNWPAGRVSSRRGRRLSVTVSAMPRPPLLAVPPPMVTTPSHLYPMLPAYIYRHGLLAASFASAAANPIYHQNGAVRSSILSPGGRPILRAPLLQSAQLRDRYCTLQPPSAVPGSEYELNLCTRRTASSARDLPATSMQLGWPLSSQPNYQSALCRKRSSSDEHGVSVITSQLDGTVATPAGCVLAL